MAERLGNQAINQKVADSIPGREKLCCVLGQGTLPYLPRGGDVPVLTVSRSRLERLQNDYTYMYFRLPVSCGLSLSVSCLSLCVVCRSLDKEVS